MIVLFAATALASEVVLHVGVPLDAGTVYDVAAHGATGACVAEETRLTCPADAGAVRFTWAGAPEWALVGDLDVAQGVVGRAWVVATEATRAAEVARLDPSRVQESDVREIFVRYGTNHPIAPSLGMWEAVLALVEHTDHRVRRAAADAWVGACTRSSIARYPPTGPCWLPNGTLTRFAQDPDPGVRRRAAILVRDLRSGRLDEEAARVLVTLRDDPVRGVRHATMLSVARNPNPDVEDAWRTALAIAPQQGGPGLAACNTLARLSWHTGPTDVIDPHEALEVVLAHRPEQGWRVWTAWREHVPFDAEWAGVLFRDTVSWSGRLLRHWAEEDPDGLEAALATWEPGPDHTERYVLIVRAMTEQRAQPDE